MGRTDLARVYAQRAAGRVVRVEHRWPRGVRREARIDRWLKDEARSTALHDHLIVHTP